MTAALGYAGHVHGGSQDSSICAAGRALRNDRHSRRRMPHARHHHRTGTLFLMSLLRTDSMTS